MKWAKAFLVAFCMAGVSHAGTVSIYTSTPTLQTDFISMTTTQYMSSVVASPYFPGSYSITLSSKRPTSPTVCPPQNTVDQQLAIATTTLMGLTSDYYLNGWGNGMEYERYKSINWIKYFTACSTPTYVAPTGVSTSTWKVPKIDTTTCSFVLNYVSDFIYEQQKSSPSIVPGF